jgi:hypothetical protein
VTARDVEPDTGKRGTCLWFESLVLPQWRPVPLLEDVALEGRGQHGIRPRWKRSDQKVRDEERLCNDAYATGGGAVASRSHLFQAPWSRLRHERMHLPVPISSDVIFGTAAGRHKLSDTDSSLQADHDRHGVAGGCRSLYLCRGCPAGQLMTR